MTPEEFESKQVAIRRFIVSMKSIESTFARLSESVHNVCFSLLDYAAEAAPDEQTPVSWEVERERFMRRLPSYDPRNES